MSQLKFVVKQYHGKRLFDTSMFSSLDKALSYLNSLLTLMEPINNLNENYSIKITVKYENIK